MNTIDSKLAGIEVPSRELHTRYLNAGLTRYGYEEIIGALQEMDKLVKEAEELATQASALIRPHDIYPGDIFHAPEEIQRVNDLTSSDLWPVFQLGNIKGGGRQEKWPVDKWQKQMATYRRANSRLHKAIEACY